MVEIKHATDATFEELVLKAERPVVVDFWAEWCGPCKMVAPEMVKLAEKYEGAVDVIKVDVDANPRLSQAFNIMSIPTIAFFKPGSQPQGVVGFRPLEQLEQRFRPRRIRGGRGRLTASALPSPYRPRSPDRGRSMPGDIQPARLAGRLGDLEAPACQPTPEHAGGVLSAVDRGPGAFHVADERRFRRQLGRWWFHEKHRVDALRAALHRANQPAVGSWSTPPGAVSVVRRPGAGADRGIDPEQRASGRPNGRCASSIGPTTMQ